jgi:phage tail sheath protein FI
MADYTTPGVVIEDIPSVVATDANSSAIAGFLGITQRGVVKEAVKITSWNAFLNNFALGMSSPFIPTSNLAYAVYGFFQNGGKTCYVTRVASSTVALASGDNIDIVIKARDNGEWGNKITVNVSANSDDATLFDVSVSYDGTEVERYLKVSNTTTDARYWITYINGLSAYINCISGTLVATAKAIAFTGGADGVSDIKDTDYSEALSSFDSIVDLGLLAIPGQTSATLLDSLITYCAGRKYTFPIIESPLASTVDTAKTFAKQFVGKDGACPVPSWISVVDPLSSTGATRWCPISGHLAGVYARIINSRGVWKAQAGTEAYINGAVDVSLHLTDKEIGDFNENHIISIVPKTNYGIVVWGARSLSNSEDRKFVSDILFDMYVKKTIFYGSQQFVFETNDEATWSRIKTYCESVLDPLWKEGALAGADKNSAYYVKCDEDLNDATAISKGVIYCEIGYAPTKPAEFVVFRFSHNIG